eukprot:CAMPEP_0114372230 /NCGR_PEP_ID=MMETSP0101-20121206/34014_1 /TAXON_ID=38822 ORGANISM="Pteridomonas danica, Strain PT" /NCGR_SAMPLE_ID=MMETSP0101 /ASSEMBLY_ACC=CAM_ASM_000211 /LENGTH=173 /DNA_ID=CAMNT_0001524975 /DNA_START=370 /DNA_END=888 /DNA_ORIENTATION=+
MAIIGAKQNIPSLDMEAVKSECKEVSGRSRGPRAHFFLKIHALSCIIAAVACHREIDDDFNQYFPTEEENTNNVNNNNNVNNFNDSGSDVENDNTEEEEDNEEEDEDMNTEIENGTNTSPSSTRKLSMEDDLGYGSDEEEEDPWAIFTTTLIAAADQNFEHWTNRTSHRRSPK